MEYDNSYKLLFSHPKMVADLVRGFVREPWVQSVDFDTLERVSGNYVSDDLRDREDDIIWRVQWHDDWIYVYLLLEFQSSVDRFMAVRLLVYIGLLYQDLIRRHDLTPSRKLPPILPLVLYNGQRAWTAPTSLEPLLESLPGGLSVYCPSLHYLVIDESHYEEKALPELPNLVASLIRLEKSHDPETLQQALQGLVTVLRAPEDNPLRRAFTVWLRRVLLPTRLPGLSLPAVEDIGEIQTMLAERVIEWTQQWKEEGLREGRQEGLQEGRQEGLQEGLQEGRQEGLQEGLQEGRQEGLQKGREQERQRALTAERALLCRQAEKRFDVACSQTLGIYLASIEDQALLEDIGEWIVTCHTGEALLSQVQTRLTTS